MAKSKIAKTAKEFDQRFDSGEDIHDLLDMKHTNISKPGRKVRITIDMSEDLANEIDRIRETIGVDRSALIKVWLHERVQKEKAVQSAHC
jgi:hypothetical protein